MRLPYPPYDQYLLNSDDFTVVYSLVYVDCTSKLIPGSSVLLFCFGVPTW